MFFSLMCIALQLASLGNASYLRHMLIPRQNSSAPSTDGSAATPATTGIATFVDFAHEGNTERMVHGVLQLEVFHKN
ncbi:MAG: hypothetical protein LQ350_002947 [Teloschistes chrysophthalmus]|nr:MAG: hypothetical protein LQ350_002947 [Niorma chrysophthalma]